MNIDIGFTTLLYGQALILLLLSTAIGVLMLTSTRNAGHLGRQYASHTEAVLAALRMQDAAIARLQPPADAVKTILVIDDDEGVLALAVRTFTAQGYRVRTALTAEDALESLTRDGLPDLIVADIRLQHMDGLQFTRQIRWAGCVMPILAYSSHGGHGDQVMRRRAFDAGCNDLIGKTGTIADDLLRPVEQWLAIAASVAGRRSMTTTSAQDALMRHALLQPPDPVGAPGVGTGVG